jgi:hypothetical protein
MSQKQQFGASRFLSRSMVSLVVGLLYVAACACPAVKFKNPFWQGKTDYNYGFMEFCFSRPEDKDAFLAAAPSMGWGEKYDDKTED